MHPRILSPSIYDPIIWQKGKEDRASHSGRGPVNCPPDALMASAHVMRIYGLLKKNCSTSINSPARSMASLDVSYIWLGCTCIPMVHWQGSVGFPPISTKSTCICRYPKINHTWIRTAPVLLTPSTFCRPFFELCSTLEGQRGNRSTSTSFEAYWTWTVDRWLLSVHLALDSP